MTLPFFMPDWMPWWVPIGVLLPLLLYGLAFLAMPFSVLGLKGRLEAMEARLDEIQGEIRGLAVRQPESRARGLSAELLRSMEAEGPRLAPNAAPNSTEPDRMAAPAARRPNPMPQNGAMPPSGTTPLARPPQPIPQFAMARRWDDAGEDVGQPVRSAPSFVPVNAGADAAAGSDQLLSATAEAAPGAFAGSDRAATAAPVRPPAPAPAARAAVEPSATPDLAPHPAPPVAPRVATERADHEPAPDPRAPASRPNAFAENSLAIPAFLRRRVSLGRTDLGDSERPAAAGPRARPLVRASRRVLDESEEPAPRTEPTLNWPP
jgi:hypothetical protein